MSPATTAVFLYPILTYNFFFQNDNKKRVIQGIIIHDVIGRSKIILDQLGEGLAVLGFHAKMAEYPEMFEVCAQQ